MARLSPELAGRDHLTLDLPMGDIGSIRWEGNTELQPTRFFFPAAGSKPIFLLKNLAPAGSVETTC